MGERPATQTITSIERAADVLTLFTKAGAPTLGVTQIARELGLSKAVVHRILTSLRGRDFVEIDEETRRYSLGPAALALGLTRLQRVEVRDLARPVLRELSRTFDETATLSIPAGDARMYIDQVLPDREVIMTVQLGHPFPLHAGSSSKALLAFLGEAQIERILAGALPALTASTVTDPAELRADLADVRRRGYAASAGERQADAASVAAAILDHEGTAVASMSVCGPADRFAERMDEAAAQVRAAAARISEQLGYRP